MTCLGTLLRTVEDLSAQLPGAIGADANSDTFIRVPGGWRPSSGYTTYDCQQVLKYWGPLTLTSKSPLDEHLADPEGVALVEAIHDRKLGKITRHSEMDALAVGTVLQDKDGDKLSKGTDGRWHYTKLDVQLATGTILATFGPLRVVVEP